MTQDANQEGVPSRQVDARSVERPTRLQSAGVKGSPASALAIRGTDPFECETQLDFTTSWPVLVQFCHLLAGIPPPSVDMHRRRIEEMTGRTRGDINGALKSTS
jgi:hypothetical protein